MALVLAQAQACHSLSRKKEAETGKMYSIDMDKEGNWIGTNNIYEDYPTCL